MGMSSRIQSGQKCWGSARMGSRAYRPRWACSAVLIEVFFCEMTGGIPNRCAGRPDYWHQSHALCDVGGVSQLSHHAFDDTNVPVQETSEAATVYGI